MSSPRFLTSLALAAMVSLFAAPTCAAQSAKAPAAETMDELQQAFDDAQASAQGSDNLDSAYELLGVAGTAQSRGLKPLADKAAASFGALVQRATATAQRTGGSVARDTLDQFVDLQFFARSQDVAPAAASLATALRGLFPPVIQRLQQTVDSATDWDDRVAALNDLGALQASATQLLMKDVAESIATSFDGRVAKIQAAAEQVDDAAERTRRIEALEKVKASRQDQVADATRNNVDAIAAQLRSSGRADSAAPATPD